MPGRREVLLILVAGTGVTAVPTPPSVPRPYRRYRTDSLITNRGDIFMMTTSARTNSIPTFLESVTVWLAPRLIRLCTFPKTRTVAARSIATVVFLVVAFDAALGRAQAIGSITLVGWQDGFETCRILDDGPALRTVFVFHELALGATASRFKIEAGPGMTMTYVSEVHSFPMTVGNSQDGMSVCYGSCLVDRILIATLTYMSYGTSNGCSKLQVVPHPLTETPEAVLCDGTVVASHALDMYAATGFGCGCPIVRAYPGTPELFDCDPVAVQALTWGAIKALYRD